ncbi:MAG: DUF6920 family protein [Gemmatimonadales bacterium]
MIKVLVASLVAVAVLVAAVLGYGGLRWRAAARDATATLARSRAVPNVTRYSEGELEGLPPPVVRYFRSVLHDGQPIVTGARIPQSGEFSTGEGDDGWRPFTATESFATRPPGYVWLADIRMSPGLAVHVRDSYLAGAGAMKAAMLGVLTMADAHDTPEMAAAALQRYLGEAPWFPTALLPSQGARWTAIDDSTARATLTDGGTTVSMEFTFDANGEITGTSTPSRYRAMKDHYETAPWGGRFAKYTECDGMRVPTEAEAAWVIDGKRLPYWRGRNGRIVFEFAP